MHDSDSHDALLHGVEDEQLASYNAVSAAAIVALVLGLVSAVAIIGPWFWFVPLLAIGAAWLALRQISRSESTLVGRPAAIIGLCLAICFGAWGPTQYFSRAAILSWQARQAADLWFQALQAGNVQLAHQWMLTAPERAKADQTLENYYVHAEGAQDQLDDFKQKEFVTRLLEDPSLELTFLGTQRVSQENNLEYVLLYYQLAGRTPEEPPLKIELVLRRIELKKPGLFWVIVRAEVAEE